MAYKEINYETKVEALELYCQYGNITRVANILDVQRNTVSSWKSSKFPDGKTDWDMEKRKYQKQLESKKEIQLFSSKNKELEQIKKMDRAYKISEQNLNNFLLLNHTINKKLYDLHTQDKLKDLSIKELRDYISAVEKLVNVTEALYYRNMPAPVGYISISEMSQLVGRMIDHILTRIAEQKEVDADIRTKTIKEIIDYVTAQNDNLNRRKDLSVISIQDARELTRKQWEELGRNKNITA